jgi:hypothetical protein
MCLCITASSETKEVHYLAVEGMLTGLLAAVWFGFLAVHLKEQIAKPHATVVPRFRETHVAVGSTMAAPVMLLLFSWLCTQGANPYGAATWMLAVFAASIWVCDTFPRVAWLPGLILVKSDALVPTIELVLRAEAGVGGVLLLIGALLAIRGWARRLLRLTEESFRYRARLFDEGTAREQRQRSQDSEQIGVAFRFEHLTAFVGDDVWRRVRLWRLGNSSTAPWIFAVWFLFMSGVLLLLFERKAPPETPLFGPVLVFSLMAALGPFQCAVKALERGPGLGWESLRPCSKAQFFRELGLAAAMDALVVWVTLVIGFVVVGATWVHELIGSLGLALLFLSAGGLVLVLGMTAWLARFRSTADKFGIILLTLICGVVPGAVFGINPQLARWLPLWIAVALAMASAGMAIARQAHRNWCNSELG